MYVHPHYSTERLLTEALRLKLYTRSSRSGQTKRLLRRIPANSVVWLLRKVRFNAARSQLKAASYTLVLGLTERIVHLLNVGVLFTAYAANIQRTSEVLVGAVLFCGGFRTLLDRGYRFDNIYSFLLPKLGAARLQDRRRYSFLLIRAAAQKGLRDRLAGSNPS